ncbi:beta-ketoacyl synthase N-terminal-like domain-containing protein [Rhodopseudomonas palustris]|uniref:Beta-ketoacyl synthase n=1 Tax=Rhodopseudomonas palustris (strain BisB18) TaxID=316056 RepID=Q212V6_RHOPB
MKDDVSYREVYADTQPIAIIGAGCRFAGARNPFSFWRRIVDGEEFTRRVTEEDLRQAGFDPGLLDHPGFVPIASVVEDVEHFDAEWFGYSPAEAATIDPQQRVFLTCAWEALDMAGLASAARGSRVGVFGSARMSTYRLPKAGDVLEIMTPRVFQRLIGNDKDYLASRVAYKLGLSGPAVTIQSACSSSLVAIHTACEQLRSGECDLALAGGAALTFPMAAGYMHHSGMIFSPDGHCRPFDADAGGTFMGNGVGVLLLKPLLRALEDGDAVIAVIRGSAVNNDGDGKAGYTAPSLRGQQSVIEEAMALAGVTAQEVGLVEAHGTATPLGDPLEVEALARAFDAGSSASRSCALGSIKANTGHLDTAAGVASLLKAAFAVRYGLIPPCLHFQTPNPALRIDETPFYVPQALIPWEAERRIAGVSSFGIGGTNCHVVVERLPPGLQPASRQEGLTAILVVSGRDEETLRQTAAMHADTLLDHPPEEGLLNYCATVAHHRTMMPYRLAVAGDSVTALVGRLHEVSRHGSLASELMTGGHNGCVVWAAKGTEELGGRLGDTIPKLDDVIPRPRHRALAPSATLLGERHVEEDGEDSRRSGGAADVWRTAVDSLAAAAVRTTDDHDWSSLSEEAATVRELHAVHAGQAVVDLALFPDAKTYLTIDEVLQRGRVKPVYRQLLQRLLRDLSDEGVLARDGERYGRLRLRAAGATDGLLAKMRVHGYGRLADLVMRAGGHLAAMLRGEVDPVSVVFPSGAMDDVEEMYERQRDSVYLNGIAAEAVAAVVAAMPRDAEIRVLEIGAGTGGTTGALLPTLPRSRCDYLFTDIGPLFLRRAEKKFAAYPFIRYGTFDFERSHTEQGLAEAQFHLIVAANVIHNARDLRASLGRARRLLAPGGILLLREITEPKPLFDFVFGPLTPEVSDIEERGGEFFPAIDRWTEALSDAGFVGWTSAPGVEQITARIGERIILARNSGDLKFATRRAPACGTTAPMDVAGLLQRLVERHGCCHWRLEDVSCAPATGAENEQWRDSGQELALLGGASGRVLLSGRRGTKTVAMLPRLDRTRARRLDGEPRRVLSEMLGVLGPNCAFHASSIECTSVPKEGAHWLMQHKSDAGVDLTLFDDAGWPLIRLEQAHPVSEADAASPSLYRWTWRAEDGESAWQEISWDAERIVLLSEDGSNLSELLGVAPVRDFASVPSNAPAGAHIVVDLTGGSTRPIAQLYADVAAILDIAARTHGRVTVMTSGAAAVAAWDAVRHPEMAGIPALLRVAGRERRDLVLRWIDVDEPADRDGRWKRWFGGDAAEDAIAVRHGQIFVPRLTRLATARSLATINQDGIYLITGGLSPLALSTADWLVAQGCREIWLVARRRPAANEADRVEALRAAGANVRLSCDVDVADLTALETLLKSIQQDALPLAGIFHLAGVLQDGSIATLGPSHFAQAIAPKWVGACTLLSWMPRLKPDFLLLYSSAATIFGPPGQAAHAVANAMLEGLARQASARGLPVKALSWGFWEEERSDRAELTKSLHGQGMLGLAPNEAFRLIHAALADAAAVVAPMHIDWERIADQLGESSPRILEDCVRPTGSAPLRPASRNVRSKLREIVALLLKAEPMTLDVDANLVQLGLDSLMFLELSHTLKVEFGVDVSAEVAIECNTLSKLSDCLQSQLAETAVSDVDEVQAILRRELAVLLRRPEDQLDPTCNLVQSGLDSLMFLEFSQRVSKTLGVTVSAETALQYDTLAKLAAAVVEQRSGRRKTASPVRAALDELAAAEPHLLLTNGDLCPSSAPASAHASLSPLQRAWWLGRRDGRILGGIARHLYVEYDKTPTVFDIDAFEVAWNSLIVRHAGLRTTIDADGNARVFEETRAYAIVREDLRGLDVLQRDLRLADIRERMSGQRLDLSAWPHFELRASLLDDSRLRLHLDIDTTCVDIESFQVILHELGALIREPERQLPSLSFSPSDYRRGMELIGTTSVHADNEADALRRAARLAGAPDLPLALNPAELTTIRFQIRRESLTRVDWLALKGEARHRGISPTALLLSIYAAALSAWCGDCSRFALQLAYSDRRSLHAQVMNIVCDASAILPIDFDLRENASFAEMARTTQAKIDAHLAHETYDGVSMLAETNHGRRFPDTPSLGLPIVFTSLFGVRSAYALPETADPVLGMPNYEYAAQPQVALNFQALEEEHSMLFNLDWVDGLFPDLMGEALILALSSLLQSLAANPGTFDLPLSKLASADPEIGVVRTQAPFSLAAWLQRDVR